MNEHEFTLSTHVAIPQSYAYGRSQKCLSHHSLYECLQLTATRLPNQLAIVSQHEKLERTFAQLHQDVLRFAHGLRTRCNVQPGQVIAVWSANAYLFVVAQYAIVRLGAILCPLNAYYKSGELAYAVAKVRPTVLIMPGRHSAQEANVNRFYDILRELNTCDEFDCNHCFEHVVLMDGDDSIESTLKLKQTLVHMHKIADLMQDIPIVSEDQACLNKNHLNGHSTSSPSSASSSNVTNSVSMETEANGSNESKTNANETSAATSIDLSNDSLSDCESNQGSFTSDEAYVSNGHVSDEEGDYLDADAPCALFFTSGTTGMPKAATLSHFNLVNNSRLYGERVGFERILVDQGRPARVCLPVPIFHAFGAMMGTTTLSTCPITIVLSNYRYDVQSTVSAMEQFECSYVYGVPAMLIDLVGEVEAQRAKLSSLRYVITAATTVPLDLVQRTARLLPNLKSIQIVYGATELSPIVTAPALTSPMLDNLDNVGIPLDFTEVKLINPATKRIVKIGEQGELLTRSPFVFLGYWNDEQQTKRCLQNNWYNTGDLATMDVNGRIRIVGRTKEIIIRGGANIYPREIEEVLITHPLIHSAAVCGYPDQRLGEDVCCWVKLKDATKPMSEKDVRDFCKNKMAYFKVPKRVLFVDDFPMTQSGKVQKFRMRELTCVKLGIKL